ncbi:DcaP family trimeric outer membrane transporter [Ruegeria sediminis]|uniref:DcaP family trimeric outer membrane transporter n=1 Tax=Ruegeria sediminis TaxID=2583820 RepID=UPI001C557B3E|nr:DcaP family trimeric outer membrane transporter [Ruegeria sediminis]
MATTIGLSPAFAEDDRSPLAFDIGSGVTVTPYGYVKLDLIRDFDYELGNTTAQIRNIGLPNGPATGTFDRANVRETRIGFDVHGQDIFARFEGDFYGSNEALRLRHAFVEWNGFIVGQNWTNYMSVETLADTVDFQGPGGYPFARKPQVRYTFNPSARWTVSASAEEDVANSDDVAFTAAVRYGFDFGMVRVSGLWRDATISGNDVEGWGMTFAGLFRPWQGGTIKAGVSIGDGTADILNAGLSGPAVFLGGDTVEYNAGAVTVSHQVNDKLKLAITGGWVDLDRAVGTNTKDLQTVHLSAFYTVYKNTTLMAEYFNGRRKDASGNSFDADRVQFAVKYAF